VIPSLEEEDKEETIEEVTLVTDPIEEDVEIKTLKHHQEELEIEEDLVVETEETEENDLHDLLPTFFN